MLDVQGMVPLSFLFTGTNLDPEELDTTQQPSILQGNFLSIIPLYSSIQLSLLPSINIFKLLVLANTNKNPNWWKGLNNPLIHFNILLACYERQVNM
jgi:hypothetical protein